MGRIDIEKPRRDQKTYWGRAKHFFVITNPLNLLCSSSELDRARDIVTRYRKGKTIPGLSEDQLWRAKNIYDSAFHPETGEKIFFISRMSAQVPCNMFITGAMMAFYKTTPAVIFWQWFNQSFNASVNYSNRNASAELTTNQLGLAYVTATTSGVLTSLTLNHLFRNMSFIGRFVPFISVAACNAVNIPICRFREIEHGVTVSDENGVEFGKSKIAAISGITQVVVSRVLMAVPSMVTTPIIMNRLESKGFLKKYPRSNLPIQVLICGIMLTFATPMACAAFSQTAPIAVTSLEPEIQEKVKKNSNAPKTLYYNKGL